MSPRNKSPHPLAFITFVILLGSSLSGCQTFNGFFSDRSEALALSTETEPKIERVESHEFSLTPGQEMIGQLAAIRTQEHDTLSDIARHFGLGFNDITIANASIAPWTPAGGSRVLLPLQFVLPDAPHKGIVLNLANMRLFYYPKNEAGKVYTYPVGIGRQGWSTPLGLTRIVAKTANPSWHVPASIHREHALKGDTLPNVVRAGPDNPLGLFAMRLAIPGYLIHGTNKPYGIGMQISHGCVQLYPEDIEVLFKKASVGMPVRIVHQPYLLAWDRGELFLEAHEPLSKWSGSKKKLQKQLLKRLRSIGGKKNLAVDWDRVDRILARADGIPTPVLAQSPDIAEFAGTALQLAHPGRLYGQPLVEQLNENDWAVRVASFRDERQARQLAAMLNHQGPPIPARKIQKNDAYEVIAGPYKSPKEVKKAAKRIRMDFELDAEPLAPGVLSLN
ncbi:MAG: L,D-transpeptidase family protein [Gammaproteobacteria bacterium]